jgi:hypothetical protein
MKAFIFIFIIVTLSSSKNLLYYNNTSIYFESWKDISKMLNDLFYIFWENQYQYFNQPCYLENLKYKNSTINNFYEKNTIVSSDKYSSLISILLLEKII